MIPLMKVHTPPNVGEVVQKVFDSGFVTEGEYSDEFERQFGEYIGNPNVRLVNSGTSALTLAAHMCDFKPGDNVISTAMTCMATNEPFHNMGVEIRFADVESDTGNIDVNSIKELIDENTKAIMMVHWAGQPCELDEINELASAHGIKTIEDAAHALRSTYKGKRIGNHSDFVCFSFQAVKHLTCVDGGAIACKSEADAERARKLRWFGLDRHYKSPPGQAPASRWEQDITESGYKFHMNNVNAAIGIENLKYIDNVIDGHVNNGKYFDENITNPNVTVPRRVTNGTSSYWLYSVLVEDKRKFQDYLKANGIAADVAHVRNDEYSVFESYRRSQPGLDEFSRKMINIPCGWWVTEEDRNKIVDVVNKYEG